MLIFPVHIPYFMFMFEICMTVTFSHFSPGSVKNIQWMAIIFQNKCNLFFWIVKFYSLLKSPQCYLIVYFSIEIKDFFLFQMNCNLIYCLIINSLIFYLSCFHYSAMTENSKLRDDSYPPMPRYRSSSATESSKPIQVRQSPYGGNKMNTSFSPTSGMLISFVNFKINSISVWI